MTGLTISKSETAMPQAIEEAIWRADCPLVPLEDGTYASYDTMFATYADSPAGKHQATQPPRFYAGHGCEEVPADLLLRLHPDTHPIGHMDYTHDTFQQIAATDACYFTPGLIALVRLTANHHDTGETTHEETTLLAGVSEPPGDITHGKKTPAQRADEEKIRRTVYQAILPEIPADVVEAMEEINSHRAKPPEHSRSMPSNPLAVGFTALHIAHEYGAISVSAEAAVAAMRTHEFGGNVNEKLLELSYKVGPVCLELLKKQADTWRFASIVAARYAWLPGMLAHTKKRTVIAV